MQKRVSYIVSFSSLFIGGLIYILFRTKSLLMFMWFDNLKLSSLINYLRFNIKTNLPEWLIYSLPDGLWIFSYIVFQLALWNYKITKENFFWVAILPFVALFSEIFQINRIVPGTFDIVDLSMYIIGIILPIIIYNKSITLNFKQT